MGKGGAMGRDSGVQPRRSTRLHLAPAHTAR